MDRKNLKEISGFVIIVGNGFYISILLFLILLRGLLYG